MGDSGGYFASLQQLVTFYKDHKYFLSDNSKK
jgi:hypothetical protein